MTGLMARMELEQVTHILRQVFRMLRNVIKALQGVIIVPKMGPHHFQFRAHCRIWVLFHAVERVGKKIHGEEKRFLRGFGNPQILQVIGHLAAIFAIGTLGYH